MRKALLPEKRKVGKKLLFLGHPHLQVLQHQKAVLSLLIVVEHCDNALPLHQGEQNLGLVLHLEDRRLRFSWDEIFGSIWGGGHSIQIS